MRKTTVWTRRSALKIAAGLAGTGLLGATPSAGLSALPASEGYASVPGGRIYWRRFGSGGKTPLLLLHGGPGAAHNYLLSMRALADERPVIFYERFPHELSRWGFPSAA
ncbi:hypothetical protein ACG3SL_04650 [Sphingomonas sp. CJ20]